MSGSIEGVVAVTGGASGIGAACCRELAARGARVAVLDRSETARGIAHEVGGLAFLVDVSDEVSVARCVQAVEAECGPVEVLVNNAGVIQVPVPPEQLSMNDWDEVVRVDQRGAYLVARAFGMRMVARRRGSIVNIASIAGMRSMPLHAYAPAKAAIISMTECLAAEWGPSGVRVNAVSPGHTITPALQAAVDKGERDLALLERCTALGRLVRPEDVARAVAFLGGSEAGAITGVNLPVDCGWLVAASWQGYGGLRDAPTVDASER